MTVKLFKERKKSFRMFNIINEFILNNIVRLSEVVGSMLLVVIGTPLISFKGGIPRIAGQIANKPKSLILFIFLGVITFFVIAPLTFLFIQQFIKRYVDYTIPVFIILSSLVIWEWDHKMRWDYKTYWIPGIVIGIILLVLEIFIY